MTAPARSFRRVAAVALPWAGARGRLRDDRVVVAVDRCIPIEAARALAVPSALREGDEVLVVGDADALYVIGTFGERRPMLRGTRVLLRARRARLTIAARGNIALEAGAIHVLAEEAMHFAAARIHETARSLARSVRSKAGLVAVELDRLVEGPFLRQAGRLVVRVRDAIHVQGEAIRAG